MQPEWPQPPLQDLLLCLPCQVFHFLPSLPFPPFEVGRAGPQHFDSNLIPHHTVEGVVTADNGFPPACNGVVPQDSRFQPNVSGVVAMASCPPPGFR